MKNIRSFKQLKRSCALITLFTFFFELVLPALLPGLASTAFAAEGDDGSAGSANYYQQELEKFGKGKYHAGESGLMTYSYPMGRVAASYNSESGWSVGGHSRIARSTKWGVPEYSDDDIFTLNGEELVYATGTNPRIYHTEHESYHRLNITTRDKPIPTGKSSIRMEVIRSMERPLTPASKLSANPRNSRAPGPSPRAATKAIIM